MEAQLSVVVYAVNKTVFDHLIIGQNDVCDYNKRSQTFKHLPHHDDPQIYFENHEKFIHLKLCRRGINAYLVSAYIYTVKKSNYYRQAALKTLIEFSRSKISRISQNKNVIIFIRLKPPRYQSIDYKWNDRLTQMALERRELDHAMSWLSTLGGGFSALGETFEHCAEMAGKISIRQLQLALRLGDPLLVARCRLWAALSLIQRGYLEVAKNLVKEIYRLAVKEKDVRLQNMCKGVWAKLRYTYEMKS